MKGIYKCEYFNAEIILTEYGDTENIFIWKHCSFGIIPTEYIWGNGIMNTSLDSNVFPILHHW